MKLENVPENDNLLLHLGELGHHPDQAGVLLSEPLIVRLQLCNILIRLSHCQTLQNNQCS